MWLTSCMRQGMLTQGPVPDPKCKLIISAFVTLPHLLDCLICTRNILFFFGFVFVFLFFFFVAVIVFCCCFFVFVLFVCLGFFFGFFLLVLLFLVIQFVCLFYFIIILFCFNFGLFVSWFPFMSVMCFLVSLVVFSNCCQWEGGVCVQSLLSYLFLYFCLFLLFFCRGSGYFNSLVGRGRNSSSAGQSMTFSVLGAFNSFVGGWVDFVCN